MRGFCSILHLLGRELPAMIKTSSILTFFLRRVFAILKVQYSMSFLSLFKLTILIKLHFKDYFIDKFLESFQGKYEIKGSPSNDIQ